MVKVYLSGKISGTTDYMERFAKEEEMLTKKGYTVVNPARVNAQLPDCTWGEYMQISLALLRICDAIHMIDGWEGSSGACIEYTNAITLGKVII